MTSKTITRLAPLARRLQDGGELVLITVDAEWSLPQMIAAAARGETLPQRHVTAAGYRHGWSSPLEGHTVVLGTSERRARASLLRLA